MATQTEVTQPRVRQLPTAGPAATNRSSSEFDARAFWTWVWQSLSPALGYILVVAGFIVIAVGWWGVAHNAIVAKQLPYLASGGVIGIALVVLGGRFLVMGDLRRDSGRLDRLEQMVLELHDILLSVAPDQASRATASADNEPSANGTFLVSKDGERYHRPGCPIVEGKDGISRVRTTTIRRRKLAPCPLCEPADIDR